MKSARKTNWYRGEATEADPELVKATELLKESMESKPTPGKPKHINIEKNLQADGAAWTRPGQGIEDVERDAMNHLFAGNSEHAKAQYDI